MSRAAVLVLLILVGFVASGCASNSKPWACCGQECGSPCWPGPRIGCPEPCLLAPCPPEPWCPEPRKPKCKPRPVCAPVCPPPCAPLRQAYEPSPSARPEPVLELPTGPAPSAPESPKAP
jgi:hypothetical protein